MSLGPYNDPVDSSATVNGTSSEIVAENTGRLHVGIENLGTVPVFIAFGAAAVLNQGRSIPVGSIIIIDIEKDIDGWMMNAINGITDGTSVDLAVSEVSS